MALGGKSETDEVDMVRCCCGRSPDGVLCVVGARTEILFKKRDDGTVIWPRRRLLAGNVRTQRDGKEEDILHDAIELRPSCLLHASITNP